MPFRSVPAKGESVRILVVDDFEPARGSICSILSAQKPLLVVGEAADGLEAVRKAEEIQPDVVLLDIGLPHLNGIDAAAQIGQVAPGARVIFVTQNTDRDTIRAALRNGAKGYLLKADIGSELLSAIGAVLRGGKFISKRLET